MLVESNPAKVLVVISVASRRPCPGFRSSISYGTLLTLSNLAFISGMSTFTCHLVDVVFLIAIVPAYWSIIMPTNIMITGSLFDRLRNAFVSNECAKFPQSVTVAAFSPSVMDIWDLVREQYQWEASDISTFDLIHFSSSENGSAL